MKDIHVVGETMARKGPKTDFVSRKFDASPSIINNVPTKMLDIPTAYWYVNTAQL